MPSSNTLAAGTVGASALGTVMNLVSQVPDSAWYSLATVLLGILTTGVKAYFESRATVVKAGMLQKRVEDLEAEVMVYRRHFLSPPPVSPAVLPPAALAT